MKTTQCFLQLFFVIGIVVLNLSAFADETVTITEADGAYRISAKGYKAVVQKDGNLHSLNISGTEMLDDKVSISRGTYFYIGGAVQFLGATKVNDTTLRAANEQASVEYEFLPDAIVVKTKQNASDAVPWFIVLSNKIKQVKNLDADEMDYTPVKKNWNNVRFTARSGAFIELRGGSIWAWGKRQVWQLNVPKDEENIAKIQTGLGEPLPKTPRDWLVCKFKLNSNDGIYKGEQTAEVTANIRSRAIDSLPMVFTFQVKDYDGKILQDTKDELKVEGEGRTKWKGAFKPTAPGFYDISITLESKGILVKNEKRTIGYEPEKLTPELYREDDFADFWKATLEELAQVPMAPVVTPSAKHTSDEVKTYKVNLAALNGRRVYAWYCVPGSEGKHPGLLVLPGYGDHGIFPPIWLAKAGFAAIAIQVRGNDVDMPKYEGKGYMTLGIESPQNYVYREIYGFCIRAVDTLCSRAEVDAERIGVLGGSQGGGLSLATAGLDRRIKACAPDVPYLSDYPEAVRWANQPYKEIGDYLEKHPEQRTQVFRTLSYFDVMNLSPDIRCPVVMGIGLLDRICPPPTEFAAYNRITAQKQYRAYPLAGHGLPRQHDNYKLRWLNRVLKPTKYTCYRAAGDINVDGQLDEPSWKKAPKTVRFVDIESGFRVRLNTVAKMLWDDEYFYVGFICEEPDVWATLTERDSVIYADNDVEVFIDPDDDTLNYYELEINALNTAWDLLLDKPYNKGGKADNSWDIEGLECAVKVNGTLNQPEDTDEGWTVEIAFPWKALAQYSGKMSTPPQNGDRWRVNFSRVERKRNSGLRDCDNWVWAVQRDINMHIPERWGYVTFSSDVVDGK